MCDGYSLYRSISHYRDHFKVPDDGFDFGPRYNLVPGQEVPIIRSDFKGNRSFVLAQWGLIPPWVRNVESLYKPMDGKAETAAMSLMFRNRFRRRRVLIPADAFYEWKFENGQQQPYLIHMKDSEPFGMGGLLEFWPGQFYEVAVFTVLTTAANALIAGIHDHMPVIISPENCAEWLDPDVTDVTRLHTLIAPYPARFMEAFPVSRKVNSALSEGAELIRKLG